MAKLAQINDELLDIAKKNGALVAEHGEDIPEDLLSDFNQRSHRIVELRAERAKAEAILADAKAAQDEIEYQNKPVSQITHPGKAGAAAGLIHPQRKSAGELFNEDPTYRDWYSRIAPHGVINSKSQFDSPAVQLPGGYKALLTGLSDTAAGAFVFNDVQAGLTPLGRRPLTIRDVVTQGRTGSDTVEYVTVTTETNAAATVAEATAHTGASGTKPESALAFAKNTTTVKTIAHWIAATTRALADAPQLRTLIDEFLRYGLEEELEDQMVNGAGAGEDFIGIANISGTQSQAWSSNALTTLRMAKTKVRTVGRSIPTAYLMHPNDWQTVDLLQDNEARYYFGGPAREGNPVVWGLPVVESEAVPEGTAYVGAWRYCVLWDREQATIQVSNSHSDFFIRNLVAILAEMRAAFGCLKPNAIVEIDLTA